jgi:hypothetical protein
MLSPETSDVKMRAERHHLLGVVSAGAVLGLVCLGGVLLLLLIVQEHRGRDPILSPRVFLKLKLRRQRHGFDFGIYAYVHVRIYSPALFPTRPRSFGNSVWRHFAAE